MDGEAEQVYSTQQAAAAVGVGAAMLRRYAQTYERLAGRDIPHTRRDGRQFSAVHITAFQQARALIDANTGLSVEAALRAGLSGDTDTLIPASTPGSAPDTAALVNALQDVITAPLVAELRGLRLANERLLERLEALESRQLPSPKSAELEAGESADAGGEFHHLDKPEAASENPKLEHGPVVRLALWLERKFKGLKG